MLEVQNGVGQAALQGKILKETIICKESLLSFLELCVGHHLTVVPVSDLEDNDGDDEN